MWARIGVPASAVRYPTVFVALELIDGVTLRQWLRAEERPWREVVRVMIGAGQGLMAAHAAGIVHRDFKPENVLVDRQGRARVTDFGVARSRGEDQVRAPAPRDPSASAFDTPLTRSGAVLGTPMYMAPEQHAGRPADARGDQFAFCVTLYEALYGTRPYRVTNYTELERAKLTGEIVEPGPKVVPRWLRSLLMRGLSPETEARYPDMGALLGALARVSGHRWRRWAWAARIA